MKRLKAGQPITVVLLSKTWRAKTLRGGCGRVYFKLVDALHGEIGYRGSANAGTENTDWARGWTTPEAKALQAATALL